MDPDLLARLMPAAGDDRTSRAEGAAPRRPRAVTASRTTPEAECCVGDWARLGTTALVEHGPLVCDAAADDLCAVRLHACARDLARATAAVAGPMCTSTRLRWRRTKSS